MSVAWQFSRYKSGVTLQNQTHSLRTLYRQTVNKMSWSNPRYNTKLFYFRSEFSRHPTSRRVFMMNERVNESISQSIFNATRTSNGFNKIQWVLTMDLIKCIFSPPSRKEKYCLKQLEHAFGWNWMFAKCVWDLQHNSTTLNHQVKYFAKANSAFTIFLHRKHGKFIVYQFKTVSLF